MNGKKLLTINNFCMIIAYICCHYDALIDIQRSRKNRRKSDICIKWKSWCIEYLYIIY